MVDQTQVEIEMSGFCQLISTATRAWKQQTDSLVDQVWVNCGELVISHFNSIRSMSDHNVVGLTVSTRKIKMGVQNNRRRIWKHFNIERCTNKFRDMDWSPIYDQSDPNVAASLLDEKILSIIDSEAPFKTLQYRTFILQVADWTIQRR